MIQAIQTSYKGYRFRSRLEARWAVFFDALGLKWEYEPEGFDLGGAGYYLPDFWLADLDTLVEIKPKGDDFSGQPWIPEGTKEYAFANYLDNGPGLPAPFFKAQYVVLYGTPGVTEPYAAESSYAGAIFSDSPYLMCECSDCGALGFQFDGRDGRNKHTAVCPAGKWPSDKGTYNHNSPRILQAAGAARAARFEHGESGAPR